MDSTAFRATLGYAADAEETRSHPRSSAIVAFQDGVDAAVGSPAGERLAALPAAKTTSGVATVWGVWGGGRAPGHATTVSFRSEHQVDRSL